VISDGPVEMWGEMKRFYTSCLEPGSTGLLRTGTLLSEKPWDQLALPPFMGFPPGINQDGIAISTRPWDSP